MTRPALFCLCLLIVLTASICPAQSPLDRRIAQLQREIAQREAIDRDVKVPAIHKEINRPLLEIKRRELSTIIQDRVSDLQKDLRLRGNSMTQAQRNHTQAAIKTLLLSRDQKGPQVVSAATRPRRVIESAANPSSNLIPARSAGLHSAGPPAAAVESVPAPEPQTQVAVLRSSPTPFPDGGLTYTTLDLPNAAIFNADDARQIISDSISRGVLNVPAPYFDSSTSTFSDDFYCVIHVLRWSNPSNGKDAAGNDTQVQTVAAQNWYVFSSGKGKGAGRGRLWANEDFAKLNRIFGARKVWLLYIHLNRGSGDYKYDQARYDFNIEKKTPANVSNLLNVAQLFIDFTKRVGLAAAIPAFTPENLWGGGSVDVAYVPSDITITASFVKNIANGPVVALDKPKKFDNEGRYWWDVSVGVPIRHISQTQFDATAGTVTSKTVDKQNAFALLNLYPVPVDIKGTNYSWIPHFIGGVAIAKQPLKKILIGAGVGPHFANFYVGALFTEQTTPASLKAGDTATPAQLNADSHKHYKTQVSFGINLPVRGIVESLKKTSQ